MWGTATSWTSPTVNVPKMVRLARPILSERPPMKAVKAPMAFDTTNR